MRLTQHITLNFNNNMSRAAVFLYSEKAFHTTWHRGLLYKVSKLKFPTNLVRLTNSYLFNRKFRVSVEGEISTPREVQAGVPQVSFLAHKFYYVFRNDTSIPLASFQHSSRMIRLYMQQTTKTAMFSESCKMASMQWRRGVSAGS
jgi:hypothetical protein